MEITLGHTYRWHATTESRVNYINNNNYINIIYKIMHIYRVKANVCSKNSKF